jgi:hypothetical protein
MEYKNEAIKRILSSIEYEPIFAVENTKYRKCWFWLTEEDFKEYKCKEYEIISYKEFELETKGVVYPNFVRKYDCFLRIKIKGGFAFVKIP